MTLKHGHFIWPVQVRFLVVATNWTPGENSEGERVLFPAVSQGGRIPSAVHNPHEIRNEFFKANFEDEAQTMRFLNRVGVWSAVEDWRDWDEIKDRRVRAMRLRGTFGLRKVTARAVVATPESMHDEQKYWSGLLREGNRLKLKAALSGSDHWLASFFNTLPVHMEWQRGRPHAVIQPITGRELITALMWIDLMTGVPFKVCQNDRCGIPYTVGGTKYHDANCEEAMRKRYYRGNLNRIKRGEEPVYRINRKQKRKYRAGRAKETR